MTLSRLPMPPSINNAYINLKRGGRAKGEAYKRFDQYMAHWQMRNIHEVVKIRQWVMAERAKGNVFHVEHLFRFNHKSIIMKNGSAKGTKNPRKAGDPKQNDTSNRIKIIDDAIANMLLIDDSYFWSGSYDKQVTQSPIETEHVEIIIISKPLDL